MRHGNFKDGGLDDDVGVTVYTSVINVLGGKDDGLEMALGDERMGIHLDVSAKKLPQRIDETIQ